MSVSVEYSTKEISGIVLMNVLKMYKRRNLIEDNDIIFNANKEDFTNKNVFDFIDKNKKKHSIYLYTGKISSIVHGSILDDYLKNNTDVHKIVVMKEPSKKAVKQITTEYPNAEFFFEHEMMEDVPSKLFIPEHYLIPPEEKEEFLKIFKESELSKINDTDIMCRYYGGQIGDIFKITRASLTAGKNIFYRKVISGNVNQLFET